MSADEIIAELRAKHGEVEALEIPRDGQVPALVVLKAMPLLDFLELQHSEAKRRAGVKFRDPREITAPLLSCVVYGLEDAQAELADCPGFEQDLMNAVARLAGALNEDIDVDFAEEPEPKKPIVLKVGQHKLTFRRLDSFDYSNARSAIGKYAKECPGLLSPLAMLALVKQQGVKEEAADLDRVLSLYPAAVESMGLLLYGTARGRAERRVGK